MSVLKGISQNTQGKPLEAYLPDREAISNKTSNVNLPSPLESREQSSKVDLAHYERQRLEQIGFQGRLKERTVNAAINLTYNTAELVSILGVSIYTLGLGLVSEQVRNHQARQLESIQKYFDKNCPSGSIMTGENSLFAESYSGTFFNAIKHGFTLVTYPTTLLINVALGGLTSAFEEVDRKAFKNDMSYALYLKHIEENPSVVRDSLNCLTFVALSCLTVGKAKFPMSMALRAQRVLQRMLPSLGMGTAGALGEQMLRVGDEEKGGFNTRVLISDALQGSLSSSIFGLGMKGIKSQAYKEFADVADGASDLFDAGGESQRLELARKDLTLVEKSIRFGGLTLKLATAAYDLKNDSKVTSENTLILPKDIQSQVQQAQRFESPTEVSANLRPSVNIMLYGKEFSGIKSTDGKNFFLDNPFDVKRIYELSLLDRAQKSYLNDSRLSEMLDKADRVVAFYDRNNDFIFAPRASLNKHTTDREIVAGLIRHEVTHRQNQSRYSASENEFRALKDQSEFYQKRGISFYLEEGKLVAGRLEGEVRTVSDHELREYVYNNPNDDALGIFAVERGRDGGLTAAQESITRELFNKLSEDSSREFNQDRLIEINSELETNHSVFTLRELISEMLEITLGNDAPRRRSHMIGRWGFKAEDIQFLEGWLKEKFSEGSNIRVLKDALSLELDERKVNRLRLIFSFENLESDLRKLLEEKRTREISQQTLDLLGDMYEVTSSEGRPVCPASFNVNLQLGGFTDLPPHGQFAHMVRHVQIHNVLDANCLRELDGLGDAGEVARVALLDLIWCDVKARLTASKMRHRKVVHGQRKSTVWNDLAAPRDHWSSEELGSLLKTLEERRIFKQEIVDERYGLPRTSVTKNQDMHARKWSTDACIGGGLAQRENPSQSHLWMRNLITNAGFILHHSNLKAAIATIEDPNWYREGDASKGIAHIFLDSPKNSQGEGLKWDEQNQVPLIESIVPDPAWFNCKRLESQALVLFNLVDTVIAGACYNESRAELAEKGKIWGFNWLGNNSFPEKNTALTESQKEYVVSSIQVLASYLLSVQWDGEKYDMQAPTVSSWEEAPRKGGCASDTGYMEDAISALRELLFSPAFEGNEVIADVRKRLHDNIPRFSDALDVTGDQFLKTHPYADFRIQQNLTAFVSSSEDLLAEMVVAPINATIAGRSVSTPTEVMQYRDRKPDTSLTLLAAYHRSFDGSPARDARIRYGLIRATRDQLMDAHPEERLGMRRYAAFWAEDSKQWILDSYMMREFDLGLIVPALVRPGYARRIAREYATISPYMKDRHARGTASSRDLLIEEGYNRFFERTGEPLVARKDATTTACMAGRQQFALPEWAAQWTIGPTAAVIALAKAKLEIIQYLKNSGQPYEKRVLHLLDLVDKDLSSMINLCLSTIVQDTDAEGRPVLRSDGTTLPDKYNTMEAFVVVPDVEGEDVWMPGPHTLTWSNAQFHYGIQLAVQAARTLKRFPGLS